MVQTPAAKNTITFGRAATVVLGGIASGYYVATSIREQWKLHRAYQEAKVFEETLDISKEKLDGYGKQYPGADASEVRSSYIRMQKINARIIQEEARMAAHAASERTLEPHRKDNAFVDRDIHEEE